MCICCCLSTKTEYKVFSCVPLWAFVLLIFLLQVTENILYLIEPVFIVASAPMAIMFLPLLCFWSNVKMRHCLWVAYLIGAITQLMVTLVIFGPHPI